jgi:hypothetical protein
VIVHEHERPAPPPDACESCDVAAAVTELVIAGETFRLCVHCAAVGVRSARLVVLR